MKKLKTCLAFFICCILSLNMVICNVKADNNVVLSNKAYLLKTGMPQKEIEKLDDDTWCIPKPCRVFRDSVPPVNISNLSIFHPMILLGRRR